MTSLVPGELPDMVERPLRSSGRRIDVSTPFDAMMPDGSRPHVVVPVSTRLAVIQPCRGPSRYVARAQRDGLMAVERAAAASCPTPVLALSRGRE